MGDSKKKMIRFNASMDVTLLTEVLSENPYLNGSWENVATAMQEAGIHVESRRCREHTELILGHFRKADRDNLRK